MMKKIISSELVMIPNGDGMKRIYVDVPAMRNDATGEVFLGDDALRILDSFKVIGMCGYDVSAREKVRHNRRSLQPA